MEKSEHFILKVQRLGQFILFVQRLKQSLYIIFPQDLRTLPLTLTEAVIDNQGKMKTFPKTDDIILFSDIWRSSLGLIAYNGLVDKFDTCVSSTEHCL